MPMIAAVNSAGNIFPYTAVEKADEEGDNLFIPSRFMNHPIIFSRVSLDIS
jgi:hypothetical protein